MPPSIITPALRDGGGVHDGKSAVNGKERLSPSRAEAEEEAPAEKQALFSIRAAILKAESQVRERYPVLVNTDAIALCIFLSCLAVMIAGGLLFAHGLAPWFLVLPVSAFAASLLHELEHDNIHQLYFRSRPWVQDLMMAVFFVAKAAPLSPFTRKIYHLRHHRKSGQVEDIEERLIGLGQPLIRRILVAVFPGTAALWLRDIHRDNDKTSSFGRFRGLPQLLEYFHIFSLPVFAILALNININPLSLAMSKQAWAVPEALQWASTVALVTWLLPNTLRHACLVLMSTSLHYYGDVQPGSVLQQTQVLDHWAFAPFQLFCFFFGSEHAIHHIVVGQPFFIRHLVRHAAWRAMREQGVRFNDVGAFLGRDNRWN